MSASACLRPTGFPWADTDGTSTTDALTADPTTLAPATSSATTGTSGSASTTTTTTAEPTTLASSTTDDSTTGTTTPASTCGDGELDPDEECDDGNDVADDGCSNDCGRDRLIFVTDEVYSGDQIGGLAGGDAICQQAAESAGLPRPEQFKAWLSDQTTDAKERLVAGKGRYLRVDGLVIADSWADLLDGELENPIVITATDQVYENGVWTGTRPDGTRGVGANHCEDWTYDDAFDPQTLGFYGFASEWDELWTFVPNEQINPGPCAGEMALYCLEQ